MNSTLIQDILNILYVAGIGFLAYRSIFNPQERLDKKEAINRIEADNKANVLEKELAWQKDDNKQKFEHFNTLLAASNTLAMNHTHSIDMKMDAMTDKMESMDKDITKIQTILEERLPRKDA